MRSMFGISYTALAGLRISWLCHFIGLHPMLVYNALSGQASQGLQVSTEGAIYVSEVVTPLANKKDKI